MENVGEEALLDKIPSVTSLHSILIHDGALFSWNHPVNLVGEKCSNPRIHVCDSCTLPILLYGRMIPCKHVFCYDCAQENSSSSCRKCGECVLRIEQTGLGMIFRCRRESCQRTYLSQRDLLAHIKHRHSKNKSSSNVGDRTRTSSTNSSTLRT